MAMKILGIESSCDDTSVAILDESHNILANVVSSQHHVHAKFGGVVPELASRAHLRNMQPVLQQALREAGCSLAEIDAIAVTYGPGLIGSLMVGVNFAKALAYGLKKPLIGVNHIRGHVSALFLEHIDIPLPGLALIVSGGHTHLLLVKKDLELVLLTKTRDDSAGEAFDKLAKMLDLGFPGGPQVDRLAQQGDAEAFTFAFPRFSDGSRDYSFSGLKTAASRFLQNEPQRFADREGQGVKDLAASFQRAVVHQLLNRVKHGLRAQKGIRSLMLGGGVACNSELRASMLALGEETNRRVFLTAPKLSTDNAAMIAAEGLRLLAKGERHDWDLSPEVRLKAYDAVALL